MSTTKRGKGGGSDSADILIRGRAGDLHLTTIMQEHGNGNEDDDDDERQTLSKYMKSVGKETKRYIFMFTGEIHQH